MSAKEAPNAYQTNAEDYKKTTTVAAASKKPQIKQPQVKKLTSQGMKPEDVAADDDQDD